ncbi:MAG: ATP-dependent DNA helicase [Gammaproteobacteria bacterium]
MISIENLGSFFSGEGPLAKTIAGYRPRPAQMEMAEQIAGAIESGQNFIAEAGTGTGKTFAYLIPAILSGKKVIVSTGTKNLQDQLFNKDLPVVRKALAVPFNAALLKGRGNYLCRYRLANAVHSGFGFSREDASALAQIEDWSKGTSTGDISEMSALAESSPVWFYATSTADNCLGQECPELSNCFLAKARKKAQESEILIVNHHLLCADWSIRETGFGELLPDVEVIIIDEAHQLADTASNFLGVSLGSKQLTDLADDALSEYFKEAADMPELRTCCENLQYGARDLRLAFGIELKKGEWREIESNPKVSAGLLDVTEQLRKLTAQLEMASVRSRGLESCFKRAEELANRLDILLKDSGKQWIRWYETHKKTFTLSRTPLNIAEEFRQFMNQHGGVWIFTSATLSIAGRFDYFSDSLGIGDAVSRTWNSPFDFATQSLFYHPRGVAQPSSPDFVKSVVEFAVPVIRASRGRAFFLFTSHRALQEAARLLEKKIDFPLLVQGTLPKSVLLDKFKQLGNAVLLGTASFWEGVDVRGEALSCVIIDKLPFASPGDPVLKARLSAMEQQGRNPFLEHQLPEAVIALRQGVGRLIRDASDYGVLVVCDPRLLKRSYGRVFLDSVPPMTRTRNIEDVRTFFNKLNS